MKPNSASRAPLLQAALLVCRGWCMGGLVAAALVLAPVAAKAEGAQESAATLAQKREAMSLREQLDRINAEVNALKQKPRSMSVDYRLRQRLADAEVLGRKLTESEAKLRAMHIPVEAKPVSSSMPASPSAAPTDGPLELAAKADILLDQAQKLTSQADRIDARLQRERVRATLQARTRHLDQDPFMALEGAKRSLVFSRTEKTTVVTDGPRTNFKSDGQEAAPASNPEPTPPMPGVAGLAPLAGSPSQPTDTARPMTPPLDTTSGNPATASVSLSFRALLDAKALAEVERLEASGDPNARTKAMSAAVAALRSRARDLQAKATALRGTK